MALAISYLVKVVDSDVLMDGGIFFGIWLYIFDDGSSKNFIWNI